MFQVTEGTMDMTTVVLLGFGTVFVGLICIVVLCVLMGKVVRLLEGKAAPAASQPVQPAASAPAVPAAPVEAIPNRSELVAVIACCLAEELGTDVSAIRICSLKKV